MSIDRTMRKMLTPLDSRGKRGVLSRGKPVYRGMSNSPKPLDLRKAILERYKKNGSNRNK